MKTIARTKRVAVITASAVAAFLALGCSEQKQAAVETGAGTTAEQTSQAVIASTGTPTPEAGVGEGLEAGSADLLPPDVTAFAPDTLVVPGAVVEITAQGSTDVTSMTLTDGLGHKYPMIYDTDAKAWRVHSRVPLKTEIDRLGLSITATNGTNLWKRVWVFLKIEGGVPMESDGC
jgi:hypothetical protein